MNLVLLLTGLLLGNSTTQVDFNIRQDVGEENLDDFAIRQEWKQYKVNTIHQIADQCLIDFFHATD